MEKIHSDLVPTIAATSARSLDEQILEMARSKMGQVVRMADTVPRAEFPTGARCAAQHLVSRMFTDAIFSQDIRTIEVIINRIDGGNPRDDQMSSLQTLFGDAINRILEIEDPRELKVTPDDSVMDALYHEEDEDGNIKTKRPSAETKKSHEAALRIVIERSQGRKTTPTLVEELPEIKKADWLLSLDSSSDVV
jgi:hypothetical protein